MSAEPELLTAVLDANGIIGLAKADCLHLIPAVLPQVVVPAGVVREVTDALSSRELAIALSGWLKEREPAPSSLTHCEGLAAAVDLTVLALAWECQPAILVSGDLKLVRRAHNLGIETISAPMLIFTHRRRRHHSGGKTAP